MALDRREVEGSAVIGWMAGKLEDASECLSRCLSELARDVLAPVVAAADPNPIQLTPEELARISQSLWRLRRDLEDLTSPDFIEGINDLLNRAFGGPDAFVRTVRAWADLVDTLAWEAERDYGSEHGRGQSKKRHVKGALLYLVSRANIEVPNIPAFLMPAIWDFGLDFAVDYVVQISNRHELWRGVPVKPRLRARAQAGVQRVGGGLDTLVGWITALAWKLVRLFSPVSPRLKAAVDRFLEADPQPVDTVMLCAGWLVRNGPHVVAASDLISVAVLEAKFVLHEDEARRKAYAREVVLAFINQETGLPPRSSLKFRLIEAGIDLGIEVATMLFEKHPPL